ELPVLRVALYEGRGARPLETEQRFSLLQALLDRGYRVTRVRSGGSSHAPDENALAVLGRFEEVHPELASDGDTRVFIRSIEGLSTEQALELVDSIRNAADLREP